MLLLMLYLLDRQRNHIHDILCGFVNRFREKEIKLCFSSFERKMPNQKKKVKTISVDQINIRKWKEFNTIYKYKI